jgi:hypothetical protein
MISLKIPDFRRSLKNDTEGPLGVRGSEYPAGPLRLRGMRAKKAPKSAAPSAPDWRPRGYVDAVLCTRCGCKGGDHRASDGKCPPAAWSGVKFPRFFLANGTEKDDAKLDHELAAYWTATETYYFPRS